MLSGRGPKQPQGLLPIEQEYIAAANSLDEVERKEAFYDIAAMTGRTPAWVRKHANAMREADLEMRRRLLAEQAARATGKTAQTNLGPKPGEFTPLPIRALSPAALKAGKASSRSSHNVVE